MWPSRYCTGLKYLCDYGTNNCNPIWPGIKNETIEAAKRGARGPKKELLSRQFTKRNRAQSSSDWKHSWAKSSPPKKAAIGKKERCLLYAPILKLQKGVMLGVMRSVMNENQKSQSQVHVTALRCLRFKPGKWGLNSRLLPVLWGRGAGSHTLPNYMTGNEQSTRHSLWVITPRPGALPEISFFFTQ